LSLVDPDNRRSVDFDRRRALLDAVVAGSAADSPDTRKLRLLRAALDLRSRRPSAFSGAYSEVDAGDRAVAFMRGDDEVLVAVQLFPGDGPPPVAMPSGNWQDVLHDPQLRAWGFALLERDAR
jgi:(1->4)-alpha-D-glucan 1-alpha-D-glucosylmutase